MSGPSTDRTTGGTRTRGPLNRPRNMNGNSHIRSAFAVVLVMLLTAVPLSLSDNNISATGPEYDGLTYEVTDETLGTAKVIGYDKTDPPTDLNIPSTATINGKVYDITSIGSKAFNECTLLVSLTISDAVTSIEDYAFYGVGIRSLVLSENITFIGDRAFAECDSLEEVKLLGKTTGPYSFSACDRLSSIEMPNLTSIGQCAFEKCPSLETLTIPDSVTSIGDSAFFQCVSLKSITMPINVPISNGMFKGATKISSLTFTEGSDGAGVKKGVGTDYTSTNTLPWDKNEGPTESIVVEIKEGITHICDFMFRGGATITSISIPDSVTTIGSSAFNRCESLTSISIPDSVKSIGNRAFASCIVLTSATIPAGVSSIGSYFFANCTSLKSINIPDSISSISANAFKDCSELSTMTITGVGNTEDSYMLSGNNPWQLRDSPRELTKIIIDGVLVIPDTFNGAAGKEIQFTEGSTGTTGGKFYDPDGTELIGADRAGRTFISSEEGEWIAQALPDPQGDDILIIVCIVIAAVVAVLLSAVLMLRKNKQK